jgi:hypothetical protein
VRRVDRDGDRALVVGELGQHGSRGGGKARDGQLLPGVDVGGRDLAGQYCRVRDAALLDVLGGTCDGFELAFLGEHVA